MKKSLFCGLLALIALSSFAQIWVTNEGPIDQSDITDSSIIVRSNTTSLIGSIPVRGAGFAVLGLDTIFSDTLIGFAMPNESWFAFPVHPIPGATNVVYNSVFWELDDTLFLYPTYGIDQTVTTNPDPVRSEPIGNVTNITATSAIINASGDAIGHLSGWYAEWNQLLGSGFPFKTDTVYVTGEDQVASFVPLTTLTAEADYKYRFRSFPLVPGTVQGFTGITQYFTTTAWEYATGSEVSVTNVTESTATANVYVTQGSDGSSEVKFLLYNEDETQLLGQSPGWISTNQDGLVSYQFTILDQNVDLNILALVRDLPSVDTSDAIPFTTLQVPDPTVVRDSAAIQEHGVIVYMTVNPNSIWNGSTTTAVLSWYTDQNPNWDSLVVSGITQVSSFPLSITNIPLEVDGYYKICVRNMVGGMSCIGTYPFSTRDSIPEAQLIIGATQGSNSSITILNSQYMCAPGDTSDLYILRGPVSGNNYPDSTYWGQISGTGVIPTITIGGLIPETGYYLRLAAINRDLSWGYSGEKYEETLEGDDPAIHLAFPNNGSDGIYVQFFGETGGYLSTMDIKVYAGQSTLASWWQLEIPIGYNGYSDTVLATGLLACTSYRVEACMDGHPSGIVCVQEYTVTIGCSTGVEESIAEENPEVIACDILGRELFYGPYRDVIAQLPLNTFFTIYVDTPEGREVVAKVMRQY